jgi:hypothetical protein
MSVVSHEARSPLRFYQLMRRNLQRKGIHDIPGCNSLSNPLVYPKMYSAALSRLYAGHGGCLGCHHTVPSHILGPLLQLGSVFLLHIQPKPVQLP